MQQDPLAIDASDPLAPWAASFHKQPGEIYLDGNSLGLLSHQAEAALLATLHDWKTRGIQGWTEGPHPWFSMTREVAKLLAPLLGASPECIALGESVTVVLHQLIATFRPRGSTMLIDELAFPTDHYVAASQVKGFGGNVTVFRSDDGLTLNEDKLCEALAQAAPFSLALLPSVLFRSGQLLDMRRLTAVAKDHGVTILWDCSHSAGVVPHQFEEDGIQLAVGCTYKYLNGGPGAVAFLYVSPSLLMTAPALAGWFGSDPKTQFAMRSEFTPALDAGRFMLGTPHVLSLAPLLGSLPMIAEAGMEAIRAKSLALTSYLRDVVEMRLALFGVTCITPRDDARRGGHLTLRHPEAAALSLALRQRGVIPDHRPPDQLRLAPAPLYTSFAECARAVDILEDLLRTGDHRNITRHDLVT
jgi:kynureninase